MVQDLRYAVRVLLQSKAWTVMVVLLLALGIGANAAIFSAINGLLLRKLPVENPASLVRLRWAGKNDAGTNFSDYGYTKDEGGEDTRATFSYPMYQQFRKDNRTMTDLFASVPIGNVNIVADGNAEIASAFLSSGNYYNLLGVKAIVGRAITSDDDRADAPPVAVISHGYWVRRFGSDPRVVGKVVQADNVAVTIVGVTGPEFNGVQTVLDSARDISFPIEMDPLLNSPPPPPGAPAPPRRLSQTTSWWVQVVGRLKPGVTPQQVLGNLGGVFQNTARANLDSYLAGLTPEQRGSSGNRDRRQIPHLLAGSASHGVYDAESTTLRSATILSVVVALVLLIVCANIANLLLSRAAARHKEISVRLSMGATRIRLVRQLLTESLVLALLGGLFGVVVAYWGRQLLPGSGGGAPLDWRVFAFVLLVALATGIAFGIAPALRATSGSINDALKETSRSVVGSRTILSKSLLVVQVAISVVLLIGAGLFLRTLRNLRSVDVGFDPQNIVLFRVNPQLNRYDQPRINSLYQQMLERLKTIPGVRSASLSNTMLLSGSINMTNFVVQGRPYSPGPENNIHRLAVAPNFFEMLGMPLLAGRAFTANDSANAPRVAVINETAARKFFANESPIGRRFGSDPETSNQIEVVGVIKDAKYDSVRNAAPATMYVPYFQGRLGVASFEVRTAADPSSVMGAIREAVRQVDPNVPLTNVSTQTEQIGQRFEQERIFAQAYALFGGLALLVAAVGLFGLMSYSVTRRTSEIGIRMALGAQPGDVVGMVMRESLILVIVGLAVGLAAAWMAGRFITALLFGLSPTDPTTIVVSVLVMTLVSAFAGYLPARRASRVDPMVALHYE